MINQEAKRARDIVRSLLDFARADAPKRQPVDFNQLVEETIFLAYTGVSQRIELDKALAPLPQVYLDANQIKQVIVNLLNNAIQAMLETEGRPAKLTVATNLEPPSIATDGRKKQKNNAEQQAIVCQISDTGNGIKPEHLHKIFDPFFTTKEVGQGTGLGLSISYGIIEKHGGTISVESTPNQGSTFTVTLPATIPPPETVEAAETKIGSISKTEPIYKDI
jgi:signal transduction histidine kinase